MPNSNNGTTRGGGGPNSRTCSPSLRNSAESSGNNKLKINNGSNSSANISKKNNFY